jgi:hypothetical protein
MVQKTPGYEFVMERAWPAIRHFFDSSFPEPSKENAFQKDTWFATKGGAMLSSAYFAIAWALTVGLLPLPLSKFNWWAYFGLAGVSPSTFYFALCIAARCSCPLARDRVELIQRCLSFQYRSW